MSASCLDLLDHLHGSVSVVGSMNVDYTVVTERLPKPGETVNGGPLTLLPGGKSANQASAAARIGAQVRMFGAVGEDTNADFLLEHLRDAGVDTSHIAAVAGPSGTTVITVDANGENAIVYSAGSNGEVSVDYVQQSSDALVAADVLGLCLESPMETVTACARLCHDAGLKVLLNDSPFVAELPAELIEASDILLVNEHEMAQLLDIAEPDDDDWDGLDWSDVARQMHDFGFNQAVITLGGDGSVVIDGDDIVLRQLRLRPSTLPGAEMPLWARFWPDSPRVMRWRTARSWPHTFPRTPRLGSARKPLMVLPLRFVSGLVRIDY